MAMLDMWNHQKYNLEWYAFEKTTRQDKTVKHILHTTDIASYIFHNLNYYCQEMEIYNKMVNKQIAYVFLQRNAI
jgi:hypothetical protein